MNNEEKNPSQSQGQQGSDPEIEKRNRENETGQAGQSPTGQAGQSPSGQAGSSETGQQGGQPEGQSAEQGDTTTATRTDQESQQGSTGQSGGGQSGDQGGSGFVGSSGDQSSDYLTKGEDQNFADQGQGAQDTSAGKADIETGQSQDSGTKIERESDTDR